jgi:uncharacterized membrane protein
MAMHGTARCFHMKLCLRSSVLGAATLAALFILRPAPAAAEFTVCNSTTDGAVNVAWAVNWFESNGVFHGESAGWFIIAQGDCKNVIAPDISAYTIYLYAYATKNRDKLWWGGTHAYCLDPKKKFVYKDDLANPPCSSGKSYGMRRMDTGSESAYTYTLYD